MNRDDRWRVSHVTSPGPATPGRTVTEALGRLDVEGLLPSRAAWGAAVYLETGLWFAGRDPYLG